MLSEITTAFVNAPLNAPRESDARSFAEPEPELRFRCRLSELTVHVHEHAVAAPSRRRQPLSASSRLAAPEGGTPSGRSPEGPPSNGATVGPLPTTATSSSAVC